MNRFNTAIATYTAGTSITAFEIIARANTILGLVGSILMVAGGYYAFRLKKREWEKAKAESRSPFD
jgi:ABC-type phosphate/phosphonate transport system permease subunit